jgi:hypothetical protein
VTAVRYHSTIRFIDQNCASRITALTKEHEMPDNCRLGISIAGPDRSFLKKIDGDSVDSQATLRYQDPVIQQSNPGLYRDTELSRLTSERVHKIKVFCNLYSDPHTISSLIPRLNRLRGTRMRPRGIPNFTKFL